MGSGLSVFSSGKGYDPNVLSMKHFEIHRVVGKGGFGKVNAVIRKKTSPPQWFAVKTLSKVVVVNKRCVDMIWNERNLLVFHLAGAFKSGFAEDHARFYAENLRYRGSSGTTAYMAPELFSEKHEHGVAADFFALGVLAHELLFGKKPWTGSADARLAGIAATDPDEQFLAYYTPEMRDETTTSKLSPAGRSLLRGLLHPAEAQRLGANGAAEVIQHEWFCGFDWDGYASQTLAAPFQPVVDESKANCDTAAADFDDVLDQSSEPSEHIKPEEQELFAGFEFNAVINVAVVAAATGSDVR
ncbi:hypothetical protein PybrP1_009946 [[Pythium] brassicae (nom. inval.)]|nr:hypothetical protein PybrP1_009946 [[Pythium] brassicae (nom. inval.)]